MAPVYREITIGWNGETYTATPDYALIQKIEQRLSLASLLNRTLSGAPPLSQLADLLAICLKAAGCTDKDATAECINAALYSEENAAALVTGATDVLLALLPQEAQSGNVPAPEAGATVGSGTSSGQSITKSPSGTSGSNPPSSGE